MYVSILSLENNKINDLSPFNNDKFKKLQKIYLGQNNIKSIKSLISLNFEELIELRLNDNKIEDITPLE